jgi:hypothetical protein
METLTIKLLHERRNSNARRKVDGYSGKLYCFIWSDEHRAYVFTTSKQAEADDLFNSQGRTMGSYFAPLITIKPAAPPVPLSDDVVIALLLRNLALPDVGVGIDTERIALAVLAAYDKGYDAARAKWEPLATVAPTVTTSDNAEFVGEATTTEAPPVAPARGRGRRPAAVIQ